MRRRSNRLILAVSGLVAAGVLATSCAHPTTDRVLEPSGTSGSSSSPPPSTPASPISDAGVSPAEPVATAIAPAEVVPVDFHMVRSPEFGAGIQRSSREGLFAAAPDGSR